MASLREYRAAYIKALEDLGELIDIEKKIESRKLQLRKTIESLKSLCENEGIEIPVSQEASSLLSVKLADEIRGVLTAVHPSFMTPGRLKAEMLALGRDLGDYNNPQSAIHMVLKRMRDAGDVCEQLLPDGKTGFRWVDLTERFRISLGLGIDEMFIAPGQNGFYAAWRKDEVKGSANPTQLVMGEIAPLVRAEISTPPPLQRGLSVPPGAERKK